MQPADDIHQSQTIANVSVDMVRDNLRDIPEYRLPPGYRFRSYRPGDDVSWTSLHLAAEPFLEVSPELWHSQFGADLDALYDRMYFVETMQGQVAGSITAWWERHRHNPQERGRIHWVVVHPAHQNRGIARAMMTRALHRLADSHPAAMLGTSSGRLGAIKVYLDFGFHPDPAELAKDPEVLAAWQALQTQLAHPLLEAWFAQSRFSGK
jgi:GNAT superfamily N-acetyltransferase